MNLLPFEIKTLVSSPELSKLLSSNLSLRDLAEAWLSLGQEYSIELGNGLNDKDEFNALCLALGKGVELDSEVVAELYYPIEESRKCFSDMKLIEDFVTPNPNPKKYEPKFSIDDDKLEEYERSKGFYFHEGFVGTANNLKEAIPFMLMHALSEGGGAQLSYLPDSYYEDMVMDEDDELIENEGNVLYCHSYLADRATGYGVNGRHYFIRE